MNCRHAQHLLDGYLDGELPASLRAEVHAHRLTCSECQRGMVVVEVAGDVIGGDKREPSPSLGFTDRVLDSLKPPPEPRVARVVRFRRVAAFLGPVLSAAAVWMVVVSAFPPSQSIPAPPSVVHGKVVTAPTLPVVETPVKPAGSFAVVSELAEGLLSPAINTWQDTQRSTRDLAVLGRMIFSPEADSQRTAAWQETTEAESGVLLQAESMWMNILAPKSQSEAGEEGPDVI